MSWYPHADRRPMPYNDQMPTRRPAKALCIHTNGGQTDKGSLYGWFSRPGNTVAAHFQVMRSGKVEQYIDTARQAYAEVQGNDHCVSAECEDDDDPSIPLTDAQIASLVGLGQWLGVPGQVASETGDGVNWHSLYADYNPHGHNCPGSVRIGQIKSTIIPALGDDVTADELEAAIINVLTTAKIVPIPGEAHPAHAGDKGTIVQALTQDWGHDLRDETVDRQDAAQDAKK